VRLLLVLAILVSSRSAVNTQEEQGRGPKQPIPFNHNLHVQKLTQPCTSCHANRDPGEMVDMPDTAQCLQCHSAIPPKTPGEAKLAAFGKLDRQIDWVRVYQIPTFVRFDHRQHAQANVKCEACHGPVAQRVTLWKEKETSMGSCMECHRTMHASLDCGSCHEPR
jgi:Cytochrome c7 and related cytochrome c/Class III cytochrome C family